MHIFPRLIFLFALFFHFSGAAADENFNQTEQQRYQKLTAEIRCPVCQGQSIDGSNADLAKDLRREVKRMILENRSDDEIRDFMLERYGDFVLFEPPFNPLTYALWLLPFALVLMLFWWVYKMLRSDTKTAQKTNVKALEKARDALK